MRGTHFALAATIAAAVALSGATGYWFGRSHATAARSVAARPDGSSRSAALSSPSKRADAEPTRRRGTADPLPSAAASLRERAGFSMPAGSGSDATFTPTIEQLNLLAAAQREKLATINVPITVSERDVKLSDGFVKLFGISDPERQTLDAALVRARHDMDELATTNVAVKQDGDSLSLVMKPFEGGADVYDRLMDVFAQTLGPDRNAAFVALQSEQLSRTFNGFGAEERTITFTREALAGGGSTYSVKDDRRSPQSRSVGTWTMSNPESLVERYPGLGRYVDKLAQLPVRTKAGGGK